MLLCYPICFYIPSPEYPKPTKGNFLRVIIGCPEVLQYICHNELYCFIKNNTNSGLKKLACLVSYSAVLNFLGVSLGCLSRNCRNAHKWEELEVLYHQYLNIAWSGFLQPVCGHLHTKLCIGLIYFARITVVQITVCFFSFLCSEHVTLLLYSIPFSYFTTLFCKSTSKCSKP